MGALATPVGEGPRRDHAREGPVVRCGVRGIREDQEELAPVGWPEPYAGVRPHRASDYRTVA
ncbi:hypothetical protein GCM10009731_24840 [Streptomyces globosus]